MESYDIFETLSLIGVAQEESKTLFSKGTRDRDDLNVYRDSQTGVIYIDSFYVGTEVYEKGEFRNEGVVANINNNYEKELDARRRASRYEHAYVGKKIVDFGCGSGLFLKKVNHLTSSCAGIELETQYVESLNKDGISASSSLEELDDSSLDTIFAFHVLEHLPNPIYFLDLMYKKLKSGGKLVSEVPHANDFLMNNLDCEEFKKFTLWSQHLVLHTRHSLSQLINYCGFMNTSIEGVQRYPLSNHLYWLHKGKPGGHKSPLALLDSAELNHEYESSLNRLDATDTLVAVAVKP